MEKLMHPASYLSSLIYKQSISSCIPPLKQLCRETIQNKIKRQWFSILSSYFIPLPSSILNLSLVSFERVNAAMDDSAPSLLISNLCLIDRYLGHQRYVAAARRYATSALSNFSMLAACLLCGISSCFLLAFKIDRYSALLWSFGNVNLGVHFKLWKRLVWDDGFSYRLGAIVVFALSLVRLDNCFPGYILKCVILAWGA